MFDGLVEATEGRPWLWAVYILSVVIPLTLLIMCLCCGGGSKADGKFYEKISYNFKGLFILKLKLRF